MQANVMETYGSGVMVAVVMVSCFVIQGYSGVVREGNANCQVPNGLENRPVEVEGGGRWWSGGVAIGPYIRPSEISAPQYLTD